MDVQDKTVGFLNDVHETMLQENWEQVEIALSRDEISDLKDDIQYEMERKAMAVQKADLFQAKYVELKSDFDENVRETIQSANRNLYAKSVALMELYDLFIRHIKKTPELYAAWHSDPDIKLLRKAGGV